MPTQKRKPVALRRAEDEIIRLTGELSKAGLNNHDLNREIEELNTRLETAHRDFDKAQGENLLVRQLLTQISSVANEGAIWPVNLLPEPRNTSAISGYTPVGLSDPYPYEPPGVIGHLPASSPEEAQAEFNRDQQRKAIEYRGRLMSIAVLCQTAARAIT